MPYSGRMVASGELMARLADGVRVTPEQLVLPSGAEFGLTPMPPDHEFAEIFFDSCREPPSPKERAIVRSYTV